MKTVGVVTRHEHNLGEVTHFIYHEYISTGPYIHFYIFLSLRRTSKKLHGPTWKARNNSQLPARKPLIAHHDISFSPEKSKVDEESGWLGYFSVCLQIKCFP